MRTPEEGQFYWVQVYYRLDPEPLVHWEIGHFEDGNWWLTAQAGPLPTEFKGIYPPSGTGDCWIIGIGEKIQNHYKT